VQIQERSKIATVIGTDGLIEVKNVRVKLQKSATKQRPADGDEPCEEIGLTIRLKTLALDLPLVIPIYYAEFPSTVRFSVAPDIPGEQLVVVAGEPFDLEVTGCRMHNDSLHPTFPGATARSGWFTIRNARGIHTRRNRSETEPCVLAASSRTGSWFLLPL